MEIYCLINIVILYYLLMRRERSLVREPSCIQFHLWEERSCQRTGKFCRLVTHKFHNHFAFFSVKINFFQDSILRFSENGETCERPQLPENTMVFGNGRMPGSIGDMIYYFCRNNLVRIGNHRRVCTRCGKWTPRAPICRDPPPPIIIRNRNRKNRKYSRKNKQRGNGKRRN